MQQETEEEILRRVFVLCGLNRMYCASYMQRLNEHRSCKSHASTEDYTVTDYNYVSIKRKNMDLILLSIMDEAGIKISDIAIVDVLQGWTHSETNEPYYPYRLTDDKTALVMDVTQERRVWRHLIIDQCPRSNKTRVSFLISFLKSRLPDLMGDSRFENLVPRKPNLSLSACMTCFDATRGILYMPCHHVALCVQCSETLKPKVCLLCRLPVESTIKVYLQ